MIKKFMLMLVLGVVVVMAGVGLVGCGGGRIPDSGGNFPYDVVSVVLTEEASALSREWVPADFPEFKFSRIEDHGLVGINNLRYLSFYLMEPSRNNVLRAIYQLRKRIEIYSANVDSSMMPGPF